MKTLADKYELLWDLPNNKGYLELVGIIQKFIDQTISANTSYDPAKFEGGKVPMKVLISDLLTSYKLGVKTLYYHNTRDGNKDSSTTAVKKGEEPTSRVVVEEEDDGCQSGACKI